MKKCPHCAEESQDEAMVCHHCGHDWSTAEATSTPTSLPVNGQHVEPQKKSSSVVMLVLLILHQHQAPRRSSSFKKPGPKRSHRQWRYACCLSRLRR